MIFKKIKFFWLVFFTLLVRKKKIIFLSALAGVLFFVLLLKLLPYLPRPKKTEKIGIIGSYNFENLPLEILSLSSNGLTKINQEGLVLPSLAKSWKIDNEGKVYYFYLGENIYWQDGKEVLAEEIHYDLPEVKTEILGPKVLKFTLQEPFAPFPSLLAKPVFKNNYVGTGKYQVKKIERNGPFLSRLFLAGQDKNFNFKFYPSKELALWGFKLGEIDELINLYKNPFESEWQKFIIVESNLKKDQYLALFLNTQDKFLSSKSLRQALAYATPKPNDETRATGPLSPNSWAYNKEVKLYQFNPSTAKSHWEKFKKETEIQNLKLKIETVEDFLALAEEIKKNWQEVLGLEVEIKLIDKISPDFQVLLMVSQIPADPDQYSFWHSTQETNLTGLKNPKIDKILEDARRLANQEERKEKYLDFQRFLLEESPVIFLKHPQILTIKRKKIINF